MQTMKREDPGGWSHSLRKAFIQSHIERELYGEGVLLLALL